MSLDNVNIKGSVSPPHDGGEARAALAAELSFAQQQSSAFRRGVGNTVDADAPSVNAVFPDVKVKQALGLQALAIANSKSTRLMDLCAS